MQRLIIQQIFCCIERYMMMSDGKIKNSEEQEFAVFCIENVAAKLDVDAKRVYQVFTEKTIFCTVTSCQNMKCCTPRGGNIS